MRLLRVTANILFGILLLITIIDYFVAINHVKDL